MIYGVIAVVTWFAVIAAKYLTAARLQSLRQRVLEAETEARKARGRLKSAENDHAVAGRGVKTQQRQKKTLERQIEKYRKELAELKK
ncbi:MAG: hypothetical protein O2954_16455 [bacterium]|nr:hypothetical protein [bacterium]